MQAHGAFGPAGHVPYQRCELLRPEGAVQPERQGPCMAYRAVEGFYGLPGERPSAAVARRGGNHYRTAQGRILREDCLEGIYRGLGVEGVEAGLEKYEVRASVNQASELLSVGFGHVVETDGPEGRVGQVLCERERLRAGACASGHPYRASCGVGGAAGYARRFPRHVVSTVAAAVFRLRDAVGRERVGLDYVCPGLDVGPVDRAYDFGPREVELLAVSAQAASLEHGAHGSVQDQYPLSELLPYVASCHRMYLPKSTP